jgi:hypothetical protein
MNQQPNIYIGKCRGGYAIFAGKSKLSKTKKTTNECEQDYESNKEIYQYWAGSASVSIENSTPIIKQLH